MSCPVFASVSLLIIVIIVVLSTNIERIDIDYYSASASASASSPSPFTATFSNFNFAAVGDTNCHSNTINIVENIQSKAAELVLGLGDYIYNNNSADCWLEIVKPIDNKIKIAIGNHETGAILTELMQHYGLTNQYYSFGYQNVHFTVMSDYVSDEIGSEQYTFVQNDLAKAASDPNIDWIVVAHHEHPYASTKNETIHTAYKWKEVYHPLFEQYNVDLVLQGHQHNYQRTYPIKYNSDTPINPIITDRNRNTYTNPEGQIFLTVGTGGASLHSLNGNKAPYIITTQDEVYGFLNVDVTTNKNNGGTTLVGTFYSNDDGAGEMTDQFIIAKSRVEDSSLLPPTPPDLPVEDEAYFVLEEGNDDVVEDADEPDDESERPDDEATESEGGTADSQ